jgi:hypothetical protein
MTYFTLYFFKKILFCVGESERKRRERVKERKGEKNNNKQSL